MVLELLTLGAFGYWGWTLDVSTAMRVVAAVSSSCADRGLLAAAGALYQLGETSAAIAFAIVATVSSLLLLILRSTNLNQVGGAR